MYRADELTAGSEQTPGGSDPRRSPLAHASSAAAELARVPGARGRPRHRAGSPLRRAWLAPATLVGFVACARFGYETARDDSPDASISAGSGGALGSGGSGPGGSGPGGAAGVSGASGAGGTPGGADAGGADAGGADAGGSGFDAGGADAGSSGSGGVGGTGGAGTGGSGAAGTSGSGGSDSGGSGGSASGGAGGSTGGAGGSGGTPPPEPTCTDGALNGLETGVDCGGSECAPCACSYAAPQRLNDDINYPGNQVWSPSMMSDNRTLFLGVYVPGWQEQIASATRPDRRSDSFPLAPTLLEPVYQAGSGGEGTPHVTPNGLALYFYSLRAGGAGDRDLYVATRTSTSANFGNVSHLSTLSSAAAEHLPWVSADQLTIYFSSNRGGDMDFYTATRSSTGASFQSPTTVTELNTDQEENGLTLTQDGLVVIFSSNRPGGLGDYDLWRAARASPDDPFSEPEPLTALNTSALEGDPALTPDGQELFFVSGRNGNETLREIFRSLRTCP